MLVSVFSAIFLLVFISIIRTISIFASLKHKRMNFDEKDPRFFIGAVLVVIVGIFVAAQFILPDGFYAGTNILVGLGF